MSHAILATPIGPLRITCSPTGVTAVERAKQAKPVAAAPGTVAAKAEAQLVEYFAGKRTSFDLPLEPEGTPFQQKVWKELARIPFGKTRTYSEVAAKIGTKSSRATGGGCGANPLLIIVPCHRVVAKDGGLGGFSSGIENKKWLLKFEQGDKD